MEHFERLVTKAINSRSNSRGANLQDLLQFTQELIPAPKKTEA